jgi:hypothetical protein
MLNLGERGAPSSRLDVSSTAPSVKPFWRIRQSPGPGLVVFRHAVVVTYASLWSASSTMSGAAEISNEKRPQGLGMLLACFAARSISSRNFFGGWGKGIAGGIGKFQIGQWLLKRIP